MNELNNNVCYIFYLRSIDYLNIAQAKNETMAVRPWAYDNDAELCSGSELAPASGSAPLSGSPSGSPSGNGSA